VHKHKIEVKNMPAGDKTGPNGAGPMTGRAAGYCSGYQAPGYVNLVPRYGRRGRGRGYGRGWGRGFGGCWYVNPPTPVPQANPPAYVPITQQQLPEQEIVTLENYHKNLTTEKADIEQELEGVKARIEELKTKIVSK
jgi:hypothetical protein